MGLRVTTLTLLFLFSISFAWGEEQEQIPWYEIELILFEHTAADNQYSEQLPEDVEPPTLDNTIDLLPADTYFENGESVNLPYQRLREDQLALSDVASRIKYNDKYRLNLHIGWRQPGLEKDLAPSILIYPYRTPEEEAQIRESLIIKDIETEEPQRPIAEAQPVDGEMQALPADNSFVGPLPLDTGWLDNRHIFGTIRLILSRYLHVDANLYLAVPEVEEVIEETKVTTDEQSVEVDSVDESIEQPITTELAVEEEDEDSRLLSGFRYYHLDEMRRVYKNELNYFDHPKFGMLVVVRDYTPPPEPEEPEEEPAVEAPSEEPVNGGMIKRSN